MKFIQIADVHLGATPDAKKPWGEKRKRDLWDSFAKVIEVAKQEKPEFLFIVGDLFHAQPLKREIKEVDTLFRTIPSTKIVCLAGNHDFLRVNSYYLSHSWAENVFFFKREEVDCMDFPEENVAVYGLSYWHREIREPLYDTVVPTNSSRVNILLAHGGDDRHIPFSPSKILGNGFDYVAAGHIHKGQWLIPQQVLMTGSLEPTDCNDVGPHGYWIGEIEKDNCNVHFYPNHQCEYCHETYEVSAETTQRDLRKWVEGLLGERPKYQYFRLYLKGRKDPDVVYDIKELEQYDRIVDVTEQLVPDYDYDKLLMEHPDSILGSYIRSMKKRDFSVVTTKALEYGVNALLGSGEKHGN